MENVKFSELPQASESKNSDRIPILQDGVNKTISSPILESKIKTNVVNTLTQQGGISLNLVNILGTVDTYADLISIVSPQLNDAYQTEDTGLVYVFTSNGWLDEDMGIKVQADANGIVEQGNTNAVSGGEVYNKIEPIEEFLFSDVSYEIIRTRRILYADFSIASATNGCMFFIRLKKDCVFRVRRNTVQTNRFIILTSTKDTLPTLGDTLVALFNDTSNTALEYKDIMTDDGWLCVYLDGRDASFTPNLNDIDLSIESFTNINDYMKEAKFTEIIEIPTSVNLFNKNETNDNLYVDDVDNAIKLSVNINLSNYIKCKSGDIFTISGKTMSGARSVYFVTNINDSVIHSKISAQSTFTAPIDGYFFTYAKDASFNWYETMQIQKGSVATSYEPYSEPILQQKIKKEFIPNDNKNKEITLDLENGSLVNGILPTFPSTWEDIKVFKENDFKKHFRTGKYLNVIPDSDYSINVNLSVFNTTVFEYNDNFELIKKTVLTNQEVKTTSNSVYLKITANKIDNSDIGIIPLVKITGYFKDNLYTYNNRHNSNTIKFVAKVQNVKNGRDMIDIAHASEPYQYNTEQHYSHGILRLPINYNPNGNPVRLILFAHSSANPRVEEFGYLPYVQYLVDQGYAVFDSFSWTNAYPNALQFMSSPTNHACYNAIYNYIIDNYNVKKDGVHLFGKSHGGYQVLSLPYCTSIPILSAVSLAGTNNNMTNNLGYSGTQDREATARDFGIEGDISALTETADNSPEARAFLATHINKFIGYNPLFCGAINFPPENMLVENWNSYNSLDLTVYSKVPTKCFISQTDSLWLVNGNKLRQRAVRKGGGIFEMRYMPNESNVNDSHHTVDTFGPFIPSITTDLGIVHTNIPIAYAEMLQFFKRFDK